MVLANVNVQDQTDGDILMQVPSFSARKDAPTKGSQVPLPRDRNVRGGQKSQNSQWKPHFPPHKAYGRREMAATSLPLALPS